jgi:RNA polymerase sigma factor (sigma-70 family)
MLSHTPSGTEPPQRRHTASRSQAEDLVLTTITNHAEALLRTARRHSLCADDASDAYQRGLEIFLRNAGRVDPATAAPWLHTVIKHEAMAVRRSRLRIVGSEEFDGDALESPDVSPPEERMVAFEDVTRAAEALQGLKPQEVRALWLRMEGRSYKQIAADLGWTYTKVNRCVTEGRRAFLTRYAGLESGAECERYETDLAAFVDGELRGSQVTALRRHLRGCGGCRGTLRTLRSGDRSLQAVLPVGLVVGGVDGGDSTVGLFVRVYETIVHAVQERAVVVATKAQLAVEATGAAKVAAVAGAAAAVAGGGAVTVDRAAPEPVRERAAATAAVRPKAPAPAKATARAAVAPAAAAPVKSAAPVVVRRAASRKPQSQPTTEFAVERSFERSAPTTQQRPAFTSSSSEPPATGGEFDLEP